MTEAVLVLLFVALIALSLWSIIDASLQSEQAYHAAGFSKGWVTGLIVLTCAAGGLVYFAFVRPRLRRAVR